MEKTHLKETNGSVPKQKQPILLFYLATMQKKKKKSIKMSILYLEERMKYLLDDDGNILSIPTVTKEDINQQLL